MLARRFFHVCAGLLCLALAYHVGAQKATAQAGIASWAGVGAWACAIDGEGNLYAMERDGGPTRVWMNPPPAGGVVAVEVADNAAYIVRANGDVYRAFVNGPWALTGNLFSGGPTPVQRELWGSLKARYRGVRVPAQTTQDR